MNIKHVLAAVMALVLFLPACSRKKDEKKIATVNNTPIFLKDFRREVRIASQRDPSVKKDPKALESHLNSMIDRRLMIDEAVQKGLSEDERFIESIKIFWEQTLLRGIIDEKTREWSEKLKATDQEIQGYYGRMSYRVTFRVVNSGTEAKAAEAIKAMAGKALNKGAGYEVTAPLLVEDVKYDGPFYAAFQLKPFEVGLFKDDGGYVVLQAIKKEKIPAPALSAVRAKVAGAIFAGKKENALEEWLKDLRRSAKINVDKGALNRFEEE